VPNTSTWALTNATLPYAVQVAEKGWRQACDQSRPLALGLNVVGGAITCAGVSDAFGDLPSASIQSVLD
jgi:alanine dehydrogenase